MYEYPSGSVGYHMIMNNALFGSRNSPVAKIQKEFLAAINYVNNVADLI